MTVFHENYRTYKTALTTFFIHNFFRNIKALTTEKCESLVIFIQIIIVIFVITNTFYFSLLFPDVKRSRQARIPGRMNTIRRITLAAPIDNVWHICSMVGSP